MSGQAVERRTPEQALVERIEQPDFQRQVALALPEGMNPARFLRVMRTGLLENPELARRADPGTILQAGLKAAADGLVPDGREGAFVLFGQACVWMPMIAGYRRIAGEYGWTLQTRVVYEADEFSYDPANDEVRHVPVRPGAERGPMVAAYATAKHPTFGRLVEVMYAEDVAKVRSVSRSKDSGPWRDWPERMWEKTVGRRLFAKLPLSEDDRRVRSLRAAPIDPEQAAEAIYGPPARAALRAGETVDLETGQVSSADEPIQRANGPTDAGASPPPATQQAEEAASGSETDSSGSAPTASSAPEPDLSDEVEKEEDPGAVVIPDGANKGLTLAQVQAKGRKGEEWLKWAAQTPASSSVGPEVHAALQRFRPDLFEATS